MKKGGSKRKGGAYERLCAKELSEWWTYDKRTDVFFRTSSSGGRATQRSKKNISTYGQYGDVQAVDPIGTPLMSLCTIECKDGYPKDSPFDLIDRTKVGKQAYGQFFEQAREEMISAGTPFWLLIARRKSHAKMIYMPCTLYLALKKIGAPINGTCPCIKLVYWVGGGAAEVYGTLLDEFFAAVKPEHIQKLAERHANGTLNKQ